jgi:hypothetical protein
MTKTRLQFFSLLALSLLILSVIGFARYTTTAQESVKSANVTGEPLLTEIANYRQWTRVNELPQLDIDPSLVGG